MRKRKIGIIAFLSILNIPVSIVFSTIIHSKLSNIAISQIVVDKQILLLFFLIYMLIETTIIILFGFGSKNVFESGVLNITDKLKTPEIMGQGQHGTARWLSKKEFKKFFECNSLSNENTEEFDSGGIIVGYEKNKKQEKIYYIDDNIHSLVVGATRSGKTRSIVLQTVGNLGLAGESMIISDPKAEIYHYTSEFLKKQGYKIITLDFKNPTKSTRYNFLQPVIDAVNNGDFRKAEEYTWDITQSLVGNEDTKMEKIWRDGEMSVIAGAIMSVVFDNKEHPEYEWAEVQKNNPLNEGLKQQIEELDGVERVDVFTALKVSGGPFEEKIGTEFINGVPEEYAEELKKGITEGNVTYEELKSGDKVILDRALLHWYPDIKVGDKLKLNIHDGDNTFQKEIEVAAIGEYGRGLTNYNCLIMAKEGAEKLTINNSSSYFQVIADKDYDEALEAALQAIVDGSGRLQMRTWKNEYDTWENAIQMTRGACYAFIIILAAISIMNLINTMINSVHVRKKELGMMQAIGMSDRQLMKMLQLEGIFYTVGTLIISIGVGSLAGYPLFLYAKRTGMFDISTYHYPVTAAIIIILTLFVIQMLLAIFIAKSVRKDSLIERIRFSE